MTTMTKPRWNSSSNVASKATLTPVTRTTVPPRPRARQTTPARPVQAAAPAPRKPARARPTTETRPVPLRTTIATAQASRIAALEAQLAAVITESNARQTRILELETSLATATTERKFYETSSMQHFDTICHLKIDAVVQEAEVGRLGADLKKQQLDHDILVAAKDDQIAELTTTVKTLEKLLETATAASDASKNDQVQQLQAQCNAIEQHASATTIALNQLQAVYDASIATNRILVSQQNLLNEQLGMSHADCESKDLQIHKLMTAAQWKRLATAAAMTAKDQAKDKQVAKLKADVQLLLSMEQDRSDDDDDDDNLVHAEVTPCAYLDPNYEAQLEPRLLLSLEQDRSDDDDDEDMVHAEVTPCAYLDPNYEAQLEPRVCDGHIVL
ncbi:hypothetical protein SDRG_07511 [Saprolegnia diclina VS20]|uniref:Uncharacterized protein n=1 Tax=Saprolegnia diclina (strain VS20) TaxID=1156394 RepID=T0QKP6_SAPDV|nr:hypothetical protein SDRG_07511 [Saprolegnia diclina VS20]EQC35286.1 hypothetical protein SDRG_07511 [Saprolegnia diclina VS20]|eukprot:XP_008611570.1 hypothetical protein SDRG_07511 [Saprolegnia diclina VS20]